MNAPVPHVFCVCADTQVVASTVERIAISVVNLVIWLALDKTMEKDDYFLAGLSKISAYVRPRPDGPLPFSEHPLVFRRYMHFENTSVRVK